MGANSPMKSVFHAVLRTVRHGVGLATLGWAAINLQQPTIAGTIPPEPLEIGHEPQFVLDLYVVDTTWGLKPKGEPVRRVLHQPVKHAANPLITGDDPSHLWVLREAD